MSDETKRELEDLYNICCECTKCELGSTRNNIVFGRGSIHPKVLFIGEGPGEQEDKQGKPFVGKAGKLLDQVLTALEISEDDYYIANIVKCRPPENRNPKPDESIKCITYLREQVKILEPKMLVCLGAEATRYIYDKDSKITQVRGVEIKKKGFTILPVFHPSAILRDANKKKDFWQDMSKVRDFINSQADI